MTKNEKKGVEEKVEPSSDKPAEEAKAENEKPEVKTEEVSNKASDAVEEFPEDAEKQKQAFYSMRKKIESLEDKLKQPKESEELDLIDLARTPPSPALQNAPASVEFDQNDPATKAFLNEAHSAREAAIVARQEAEKARAQMEDFETWQKYPNLNPKSKNKDKRFIEDVKRAYIAEKLIAVQKGNPSPKLVDIADKVQEGYKEIIDQAKQQGASEAMEIESKKEAANLESKGTELGETPKTDKKIEELRDRVRHGDEQALMELNKLLEPSLQA